MHRGVYKNVWCQRKYCYLHILVLAYVYVHVCRWIYVLMYWRKDVFGKIKVGGFWLTSFICLTAPGGITLFKKSSLFGIGIIPESIEI